MLWLRHAHFGQDLPFCGSADAKFSQCIKLLYSTTVKNYQKMRKSPKMQIFLKRYDATGLVLVRMCIDTLQYPILEHLSTLKCN